MSTVMDNSRQSWLPEQSLHIPIPRGTFYLLRVVIGLAIAAAFLGFFCALAVKNLLEIRGSSILAIVASALWILLLTLVTGGMLYASGPKQAAVNFLGHFSRKHFVALVPTGGGPARIGFGFQLFGLKFYRLLADLGGIAMVDWSSGQGSHFARKDIGDWDVAVWVSRESIRGTRPPGIGHDAMVIYLAGFCHPRSIVESFGRELVEFLQKAYN
jgi:hypothetical protein